MSDWFASLSVFETILYIIAGISSLFFIVKSALMMMGIGMDVDIDADMDVDVADPADGQMVESDSIHSGLHFFSLHGILAFFAVGSWATIAAFKGTGSAVISSIIGLVAGAIMMVVCAYIVRALLSLEENGNVDIRKAIGQIGEVYLTIPKLDDGEGKVNLVLNNKLQDYQAISRDETPIETGAKVRVVDLTDDNILVVQRESEELV